MFISWLSLTLPSAVFTAMAASPMSIRYSLLMARILSRTSSALASDSKTIAIRSAMVVGLLEGLRR